MTHPTLVNLTPHPIGLSVDGVVSTIPASGTVARVAASPGAQSTTLHGVPVFFAPRFGDVEGLPEPQEGVVFLVSLLVGNALREVGTIRPDVLCPGTGPQDAPVRDEQGRIVAVTRLVHTTTSIADVLRAERRDAS
jgi:hypothetical protein